LEGQLSLIQRVRLSALTSPAASARIWRPPPPLPAQQPVQQNVLRPFPWACTWPGGGQPQVA